MCMRLWCKCSAVEAWGLGSTPGLCKDSGLGRKRCTGPESKRLPSRIFARDAEVMLCSRLTIGSNVIQES